MQEVEGCHVISHERDFHKKGFLPSLADQVGSQDLSSEVKITLLRFLFLVVGSGFLAHWKNLAFTQSQNDKLVSIIGGNEQLYWTLFL